MGQIRAGITARLIKPCSLRKEPNTVNASKCLLLSVACISLIAVVRAAEPELKGMPVPGFQCAEYAWGPRPRGSHRHRRYHVFHRAGGCESLSDLRVKKSLLCRRNI